MMPVATVAQVKAPPTVLEVLEETHQS